MLSNHLILCHPLLHLPSVFPSFRVFTMSQLFPSGGQSIGASATLLAVNIQGWFPLGLMGLISLQSKGLFKVIYYLLTNTLKLLFSSVVRSYPTACHPMDCSTPGFPVHHQLLQFAQAHVNQFDDAIQRSHPLSSPSPPAFNLSQHQGSFQMSLLFASGGQSIGVSASTSVLLMNIQDSFPLGWTDWISLQSKGLSRVFSKGLSRVFSNTTVQKYQFFGT